MEREKLLKDLDDLDTSIELALEGKDPAKDPGQESQLRVGSASLAERTADPNSQSNFHYHNQVFGDAMLSGALPGFRAPGD